MLLVHHFLKYLLISIFQLFHGYFVFFLFITYSLNFMLHFLVSNELNHYICRRFLQIMYTFFKKIFILSFFFIWKAELHREKQKQRERDLPSQIVANCQSSADSNSRARNVLQVSYKCTSTKDLRIFHCFLKPLVRSWIRIVATTTYPSVSEA